MDLSKNTTFLADRQKMLEKLKHQIEDIDTGREFKQIEKEEKIFKRRMDTLLDKLEDGLIEDEVFRERYQKAKESLSDLEERQAQLVDLSRSGRMLYKNIEASLEEISSFGQKWDFLDDIGRAAKVRTIVKEIRATKENIEIDLWEVDNVSSMDCPIVSQSA
jgi:site-specific DNA recombinase